MPAQNFKLAIQYFYINLRYTYSVQWINTSQLHLSRYHSPLCLRTHFLNIIIIIITWQLIDYKSLITSHRPYIAVDKKMSYNSRCHSYHHPLSLHAFDLGVTGYTCCARDSRLCTQHAPNFVFCTLLYTLSRRETEVSETIETNKKIDQAQDANLDTIQYNHYYYPLSLPAFIFKIKDMTELQRIKIQVIQITQGPNVTLELWLTKRYITFITQ